MKRETLIFPAENISADKLLNWAGQFDVFTLLNSNSSADNPPDNYSNFDLLLAVDPIQLFSGDENPFELIKSLSQKKDWHIFHLSYDLKNRIEKLDSNNLDYVHFPEFLFYCPAIVFEIKDKKVAVHYFKERNSEAEIRELIKSIECSPIENFPVKPDVEIKARISRDEYITTINQIKDHIQQGDIYEMNYCQEFYSENAAIDPYQIYRELNEISPMPFSVFSKCNDHYLMCTSPERYLANRNNKIISQPIKGTARRGKNKEEDQKIKEALYHDEKERSENVMIVDLVRNDLSRTAAKGSVNVEELFGIKTFKQLHQMVSTVTSEIEQGKNVADILQTTFPMGSMTGAPKIRAMQIIEETEKAKRGLYSGSVGYISPDGDFDFNVIIRSILYNEKEKYLSFTVGSAITIGSKAENEYEECLLKASAMKKVLGNQE